MHISNVKEVPSSQACNDTNKAKARALANTTTAYIFTTSPSFSSVVSSPTGELCPIVLQQEIYLSVEMHGIQVGYRAA